MAQTPGETLKTPAKSISGLRKNLWEYGIDFALNTGDNIPAIGLGTWRVPPQQLQEIINNAVSLGYRHFDFSTFDDGSEVRGGEVLGEYIHNPILGRNPFFITGKLSTSSHHRWKAIIDIEELVRDLRCHHLDLLLMQHPTGTGTGSEGIAPTEETWRVLENTLKEGKTRAIGVSNFTLGQLKRLCSMCEFLPAVLQMECHPLNCPKDLIDFCHSKGIHIVCYSPFASDEGYKGLLNNKTLLDIGKKYNKTPSQVNIRWNIQNGRSVIPRTVNLQHLKENLQVFDFQLTSDELKQIDSLNKGQTFVQPEKHIGVEIGQTEKSQAGIVGIR